MVAGLDLERREVEFRLGLHPATLASYRYGEWICLNLVVMMMMIGGGVIVAVVENEMNENGKQVAAVVGEVQYGAVTSEVRHYRAFLAVPLVSSSSDT